MCGLVVASHAQELTEVGSDDGRWQVRVAWPQKESPAWLVNGRYLIEPHIAVNAHGEIFVLLLEKLAGVDGYVSELAMVVSPTGHVQARKSDAFPWTDEYGKGLRRVAADPEGDFWVWAEGAAYGFSTKLEERGRLTVPLGPMFFRQEQLWLGANRGSVILDDTVSGNDSYVLVALDHKRAAIAHKQALPATGYGKNGFFVPNPDGSFYFVLNTVVLKGPDHHDVHLYRFLDSGQLTHHRHLRGQSELTQLQVDAAQPDGAGGLLMVGQSDSPVDFANAGFYPFPSQESHGSCDGTKTFRFTATYSDGLELAGLTVTTSDGPYLAIAADHGSPEDITAWSNRCRYDAVSEAWTEEFSTEGLVMSSVITGEPIRYRLRDGVANGATMFVLYGDRSYCVSLPPSK